MKFILGIDPGVSGAYAIIRSTNRRIALCKLFTNFETVREDLEPYLGEVTACIEKATTSSGQGVVSAGTFMQNFGAWEGILQGMGIPVTYVSPTQWPKKVFKNPAPKRSLTGISEKDQRKVIAENRKIKKLHTVAFVLREFPRSRRYFKLKKDYDKADALCIALYKRIQLRIIN